MQKMKAMNERGKEERRRGRGGRGCKEEGRVKRDE
jgi:hypothetical protein